MGNDKKGAPGRTDMGKIIAVVNQKGGVGKTTTCVNLACALHMRGKKVLLCDCDPQGNSTSGFGVDKNTAPNTYDVIMNGEEAENAVIKTKFGSLIPANRELTGALIELVGVADREFVLKRALEPLKEKFDYIFIDCPPSLELLTLNALCAADSVLVPVQCEYFALEGLTDLVNTVKTVNKRLNKGLKFEGFVLTMYDPRTKLSLEVEEERDGGGDRDGDDDPIGGAGGEQGRVLEVHRAADGPALQLGRVQEVRRKLQPDHPLRAREVGHPGR